MEFRTTRIIWAGPGYYQEYRDRQTFDFAWVPIHILPQQIQVEPQDGVYFKAVPPSFEPIRYIAIDKDKVYDRNGLTKKNKSKEIVNRTCPAFGWGYNRTEESCQKCKKISPGEFKNCNSKTNKIRKFLREQGWNELKGSMWLHPINKTQWNPYHAVLLAEVQEKKSAKRTENPFPKDTKSAILFKVIDEGVESREKLNELIKHKMPGHTYKNYRYANSLLSEWRRKGIKKTDLILIEDEKGIRFETEHEEKNND